MLYDNELVSKANLHKEVTRYASNTVEKAKSLAANSLEKTEEFRECLQSLRDEILIKEDQVMKMKGRIFEYQIIMDQMKEEYEGMIHTLIPFNVEK